MSFWDDLKDLFKTDDQKDEEQKRRLAELKAGESELEKKLAALDEEYQKSKPQPDYDLDALFPKDSGLKEIEYTARTDQDIADAVGKEIDYKKANDKNKLESNYASSRAALDKSKSQADKSLRESYQDLEKVYEDLRRRAENDAIKRGVARSSIVTSNLSDLDKAKMISAGEIESAYNETIGGINQKINLLEADKDAALGELDLKYASELTNKIADLKAERDEVVRKYEKYNSDIREKQAKYETQRQKDIDAYIKEKEKEEAAYEKKYGYTGAKLAEYQKRYDMAYDFYMALSPDIAVNALKNASNMKYYLGNFYDRLLDELNSRVKNISGNKKTYW